jgi:drug/metabolite transporter (DMT)-like permease
MSLVALDRAQMGIASTLCSLSPVFILPFAAWIHRERIGPRAILGALLAVGGTAVLFGAAQNTPEAVTTPSPAAISR